MSTTLIKNLTLAAALFLIIALVALLTTTFLPEPLLAAIEPAGVVLSFVLGCAALVGVALGVLRSSELRRVAERWLRRGRFRNAGERVRDFERRVDAVVIPIGPRHAAPAEWIVRHLRPRRVSLLYTPESRGLAAELARKLGGECESEFDPSHEEIQATEMMLTGLLDPQEARRIVSRYLERFRERGLAPERTFVDTTGGTAPMSLGAFQAAEGMGVSSIYMTGLMSDGERRGLILDPKDPEQGLPRFMSDHTGDRP